jgi:hypothetical protein
MSYNTINQCANDMAFQARVTACVAQEGKTDPQPQSWMYKVIWGVSGRSDIEAAYASALAADNPNPGGDESVITDLMILGAVQQELADLPPEA